MARKKRIIYPGYCYHVMMRGVGGRNIFNDDQDRARFCLLLQYASETGKFSIHGFCLMGNHVHLLLQPHAQDLASGMHRLGFRYAQHFNKKLKRQGYLFQGRYKAIVIQQGIYLRRLIRYIHRNPVRAKLINVNNLSEYSWSSHQSYIGDSKFTWLKTDLVLPLFDSDPNTAVTSFQNYVSSNDAEAKIELDEIRNSMRIGAYGNNLFVDNFYKTFESSSIARELDQQERSLDGQREISLDILLNALIKETAISIEELQSSCRNAQLVDARAVLVWLILRFKLGGSSELANFLHRDPTSIARLKLRAQQTPKLRQLADGIASTLFSELKLEIAHTSLS